ncbi:putative NADH-flavin reductase [Natronospira proteinivora]|uniref:NADH-flavin reductase n=1 Tax=Natronospira proteinivora TaxID=1807133 RepID=A0ABT1G8A6_9GAMM|nr:NAD(P)H-binding protein [Natronospira proteinivora]MCP1726588.1 putative NADH-flavin reductase [Natronospira proteinivora]
MKLIVFGATGDVGRMITSEALSRGHCVTAVARKTKPLADIPGLFERADADLLANPGRATELITGHDAAISALRPPQGREPQLVDLTRAVLGGATANDVPVFVTGGAATLKLPDGSGHTVLSAPAFLPDSVRPIAEACAAQQALLDPTEGVAWFHLLPPPILIDGPRTGTYGWGRNTLVTDAEGTSQISYADFAAAMIDLVESPPPAPMRGTVAWQ